MSSAPKPTASKRASMAGASSSSSTQPPGPKPSATQLSSRATIAAHAVLQGPHRISLGAHAILHPLSRVVAGAGDVRVGEGCVVWERAVVGRPARDDGEAEEEEGGGECLLERNVVVESGAVVRAKSVGEGSVVDVGAVVGDGAVLGKFCRIAPRAVVAPGAVLADRSVVWAAGAVRVDEARADAAVAEIRERGHAKMLKSLQALVPSKASNWQ